jgi:hypothetical protein
MLQHHLPDGQVYPEFRYLVVRVWQQPVDAVLAGGLATLPLAPLAAGAEAALPDVMRRMSARLGRETTPAAAAQLWTATYALMGLRHDEEVTRSLLRGVRNVRESVTYQAILEGGRAEGRTDEARRIVLRLGARSSVRPTGASGPHSSASRMSSSSRTIRIGCSRPRAGTSCSAPPEACSHQVLVCRKHAMALGSLCRTSERRSTPSREDRRPVASRQNLQRGWSASAL